ncbi:MAG TPA: ATP-binding protein [Chthoniobacterales bacterium]
MSQGTSIFFDRTRIGLRGLIRLRWMAAAGQALTCLVTFLLLRIPVPLTLLLGCIGVTLITNTFMEALRDRFPAQRTIETSASLLILDTFTLTAMLYWTGGVQNPFTTFYLLHITIAAILLPSVWAWLIPIVCAACQGVLFLSTHTLVAYPPAGLWVATVLTAAFIAFFVSKLSRELMESRALSVRNERFASLATLAAGIAHELATPLGTIAVVSADFERMTNAGDEAQADARLIRTEVERCRHILQKLSNQVTHGTEDVEKSFCAWDIPALLTPYLKRQHRARVEWRIPDRAVALRVPETPLLQALAVLVKNACEASQPEQSVFVMIEANDKETKFSVRDEGCGMPQDVAARAGEPFFTTKEPGAGMGLGLFLVRTFVERVRGRLDIQTAPGEGTRITLLIPNQINT